MLEAENQVLVLKDGQGVVGRLAKVEDLRPVYVKLPPLANGSEDRAQTFEREGFDCLPSELDPGGGGNVRGRRGEKKRAQIRTVVAAVGQLVRSAPHVGTMVDMCGGCGHVGLVLAAVYPGWQVVVADRNPKALDVVKKRAEAAGMRNVSVWEGNITNFAGDFQLAVALHACGAASDVAIAKALAARAPLVCVPCCVGKISSLLLDPWSGDVREVPLAQLSGTGGGIAETNEDEPWRARSRRFRQHLTSDDYGAMVRAADFGDSCGDRQVGSWRRAAKSLVEMDRGLWISEHGYEFVLTKITPLESTPKNDVIIAWPATPEVDLRSRLPLDTRPTDLELYVAGGVMSDFPAEDVERLRREMGAVADTRVFTELGGNRHRKLVHAVAEEMGLWHRSTGEGKDRRVVVRRPPPHADTLG